MSICKFILFTHGAAESSLISDAVNFGKTVVGTTVKNAVINKAAGAVHEAIIGKNDKSSTAEPCHQNVRYETSGLPLAKEITESSYACALLCDSSKDCGFWNWNHIGNSGAGWSEKNCVMFEGNATSLDTKADKCDSGVKFCAHPDVTGAATENKVEGDAEAGTENKGAASGIAKALGKTAKNLVKKKVFGPFAGFLDKSLITNTLSTTKKLLKGVAKIPKALITNPLKTTKTVLETGVRAVAHTAKSAIKDPKLIVIGLKTAISGKPSVSSIPFAVKHATSGIDKALDDVAGQLDPKNLTRRNLLYGQNRQKVKTVLKNAGKVGKEAAKSAGRVVKEAAKSAGRVGKATVKSAVKDPKVLAMAAGSLMTGVPNPALVPLVAGHLAAGISDVEAAGQRTLYV